MFTIRMNVEVDFIKILIVFAKLNYILFVILKMFINLYENILIEVTKMYKEANKR